MSKAEKEKLFIEVALNDPQFRAMAIVVGALMPFKKPMQEAILHLVIVKLQEASDGPTS